MTAPRTKPEAWPIANRGGRGRFIDHAGRRFGKLSVARRLDHGEIWQRGVRSFSALWLCRCACGRERAVLGSNLRAGRSRSCGRKPCREAL